ncbi:hypothetical protein L6452_27200 [Arctium lappa]|uniref:Uncharacterized protein n=1 Tax=Arctium lappa TaxID=4217 RepID=A0ACB8ZWY0_ARCLA|nr:hypothetical protein L6452_27200 [Arctium lappa]
MMVRRGVWDDSCDDDSNGMVVGGWGRGWGCSCEDEKSGIMLRGGGEVVGRVHGCGVMTGLDRASVESLGDIGGRGWWIRAMSGGGCLDHRSVSIVGRAGAGAGEGRNRGGIFVDDRSGQGVLVVGGGWGGRVRYRAIFLPILIPACGKFILHVIFVSEFFLVLHGHVNLCLKVASCAICQGPSNCSI